MDSSSKLNNIVDQSDPHHDCYKGCEIIMCLFYVKPNFRIEIFLKNTQASSRLVIVLVEQIEHLRMEFPYCLHPALFASFR